MRCWHRAKLGWLLLWLYILQLGLRRSWPSETAAAGCSAQIEAAALTISQRQPKEFLARVRDVDLQERRPTIDSALGQANLSEAESLAFLLNCLEELSRNFTEQEAKLLGTLYGCCNADACRDAAKDLAVRRKVLSISLRLWKRNTSQFTALRMLERWRVEERDAKGQNAKGLRRLSEDVCSQENWQLLVAYLQAFPGARFAKDTKKMDALIDKLCKEESFKAAIQVAKHANRTSRIGGIYLKLQMHQIKTGASSEGKEIAAVVACGKDQRRQKMFVRELYRSGKLHLAAERINAWGLEALGLKPQPSFQKIGARRIRKFHRLPSYVKILAETSAGQLAAGLAKLKRSKCIGFDTESTYRGKPALLQMASRSQAVLVDLLNLKPKSTSALAPRLARHSRHGVSNFFL